MRLAALAFRLLDRVSPPRAAYAHCDIPCGIYDPHLAQIAALSTVRMNQLIQELPKPGSPASAQEVETYQAKLARYIAVKEHHAELCKHELRIIWGDYFKPEHLQQHPDLHTQFWNAMKQASKVRQEVNMAAAQELLATVQKIAETFWKTKGAEVHRQPSLQTGGGELLYPVPKR
ncbi:MAG: superoxide dismutase, Ni [Chloroflexi bacterium]|nr:superoxide dismutase, Ni [Chloroflexota bacterium]